MLSSIANNSTANTVTTVLAGATVMHLAASVYDKLTGNAYTEKELRQIGELKRLYRESLHLDTAPEFWQLDEKNRPVYRIKQQNWSIYLMQLKQGKTHLGNFHYQKSLVAEYAATYLIQRSKRFINNGRSGDPLEQFFGEWIHFALNDLPTYGYDDLSVDKLKQRLKYLNQVQNHESLFKHGRLKRSKNKFDTLNDIQNQLQSCINLAKEEALRQCARDGFMQCRRDASALLLGCARVIYYARASDVHHEPLELKKFISTEDEHTINAASRLYQKIKETHTGAMLYEVIYRIGLAAFGETASMPLQHSMSIYFNEQFQPLLPSSWKDKAADLPAWVMSQDEVQLLVEYQQFATHTLRVAQLKRLVEDAYDLTGQVGDLWAYGDKKGKRSLEALLFLLETELEKLKNQFDHIYQYHSVKRQQYNLVHRINGDQAANPNFNKVDDQQEDIGKHYRSIKEAIHSIRIQMVKFPEDAPKDIDNKKRAFYQAVFAFIQNFYPEQSKMFQLLQENASNQVKDKSLPIKDSFMNIPQIKKVSAINEGKSVYPAFDFKLPLRESQDTPGFWYFDSLQFRPFTECYQKRVTKNSVPPKNWQLGASYDEWVKSYLTRYSVLYTQCQSEIDYFKLQLPFASRENIIHVATHLESCIKMIKQTIQYERPAWRFKLSLWPIKTKGWPFNRNANVFADLLLQEVNKIENYVQLALEVTKEQLEKKRLEVCDQTINSHLTLVEQQAVVAVPLQDAVIEREEKDELYATTASIDRRLQDAFALLKHTAAESPCMTLLSLNALQEMESLTSQKSHLSTCVSNNISQPLLSSNQHSFYQEHSNQQVVASLPATSVSLTQHVHEGQVAKKIEMTEPLSKDNIFYAKTIEGECKVFNKWYKAVLKRIGNWQRNVIETPSLLFKSTSGILKMLDDLMSYRCHLPLIFKKDLDNACVDMIRLLQFYIKKKHICTDRDRKDQIEFLIQFFRVVIADDNQQQKVKNDFVNNCSEMFTRIESHGLVRSGNLFSTQGHIEHLLPAHRALFNHININSNMKRT